MYKKVLFTTDGSKFAEESLPHAADLAKQCGAELEILTVIENAVFYGTPEATALYDTEFYRSLASELERLAQGAIDRGVSAAKGRGVSAKGKIRRGSPADELVAEAREWGADVIVLSTHGRTGMSRLFLGSVANAVVHHAPCPVLLHRVGK